MIEKQSPSTGAVSCRIGPVVLGVEDASRRVALGPELSDFRIASDAPPHVTLSVERGTPAARPETPPVAMHRAGWDAYRDERGLVAIKAIPYGSDRIVRSVEIGLDGGTARLRVSPDDDEADRPFAYTLSELLVLAMTRVSRAMLVHSACVKVGDAAVLMAGVSGSGKSTMSELWERSGRGVVLGDESHLVWLDDAGQPWVTGTPWPGSSGLYSNRSARVERVFVLEHGPANVARGMGAADAMLALMSHTFLPTWDGASVEAVVDVAAGVARSVPVARLAFVPDESVVEFLCEGGE